MLSMIAAMDITPLLASIGDIWGSIWPYLLMFIGFSFIIFVHELGHFLAAKACGIRVEQFAIGFFREIWGFQHGETRYSFNLLPLGGYVKMLGQEDFEVDKSGELKVKDDPRSFSNKSIGARMIVVSAGVIANVVLAGVFFAIVYMVGLPGEKAQVGYVLPDMPADVAGLRPGDVIESINDEKIYQFKDLSMAIALAEPLESMDFVIDRNGETMTVPVIPLNLDNGNSYQQVGIGPSFTETILAVGPSFDKTREDVPKPEDKLVSLNGTPITEENANQEMYRLIRNPSVEADIVVERLVNPKDPKSETKTIALKIPSRIALSPSNPNGDRNETNILGLSPLTRVSTLDKKEDSAAARGGLKPGDMILKWGDIEFPTGRDIKLETKRICRRGVGSEPGSYDIVENDIPVTVLRKDNGNETKEELVIRPTVKRTLVQRIKRIVSGKSNGRVQVGADFDIFADDSLVIGKIVPTIDGKPTPASLSKIPAEAKIIRLNDQPLFRWPELAELFIKHAGETVKLTYVFEGEEQDCEFAIPHSLRTLLGLSTTGQLISIDGDESVLITKESTGPRGITKKIEVPFSVEYWQGTYAKLQECLGKTVTVKYQKNMFSKPETAEVTITEDMLDPWVGRIDFTVDIIFTPQTIPIQESNPFSAMWIGAKDTWRFIMQVYVTMHRMIFSRSLGVESMSGPVGIVKIGGQMAESGVAQLLFFLAIISANLAVINFLPLPIVDGGHMVFLCIEKIKGSPVSIKIQMASQVVGLFLIVIAFLFVTLQDILR